MTRAETPIPLEISYPDTPKGMSDAEWHARVDLAAAYRLTHHYGWTSVVYNHITLRVPGTDTFLINPFGLTYNEITASNLTCVDLDGKCKIADDCTCEHGVDTDNKPFWFCSPFFSTFYICLRNAICFGRKSTILALSVSPVGVYLNLVRSSLTQQ